MSQKGKIKVKSTSTNRIKEKIPCSEILKLGKAFSDISKRNLTTKTCLKREKNEVKSTSTNRIKEKIPYSENLKLGKTFSDIPIRNFDNTIYWDKLSNKTTKICKGGKDDNDKVQADILSDLTCLSSIMLNLNNN